MTLTSWCLSFSIWMFRWYYARLYNPGLQDAQIYLGISGFPALFFAFVVILAHLESAADTWTANNVAICDQEDRLGLAFRLSETSLPLIEQLESRFHRGSNVSFNETEKNSSSNSTHFLLRRFWRLTGGFSTLIQSVLLNNFEKILIFE
jgi:hypothetical protein